MPKEDDSHQGNSITKMIEYVEEAVGALYDDNKKTVLWCLKAGILTLYLGFVLYVLFLDFHRALSLLLLTMSVAAYFSISFLWNQFSDSLEKQLFLPMQTCINQHKKTTSFLVKFFMVVSMVTLLTASGVFTLIIHEPIRLVSAFGLVMLLVISFVVSKRPSRIKWKTVIWGLYLQIVFAIFILRTQAGFHLFKWIGLQVEIFLNYALVGADFVFGPEPLKVHFFALVVLPVIIFASAVFSLLFYFGIMQKLIKAFAWLMHHTMGVSGVEAFGAAANVFLGMTIVPLCIKPYLADMTTSEIHSIMVGGFATIAGSVLAAYVNMGISAAHLLSASIISAPAALVVAKMFYPETERPKTATIATVDIEKVKEKNCLEAFCNGAIDGTKICACIIGNLIAIVSLLEFVNMTLLWLGNMADIENLSFSVVCSYVLYPFAWLLGIQGVRDRRNIASLIGTKTFLNEFVAFEDLQEHIDNNTLLPRSQIIATYALCGFSNFGSVGILIGGLAPLVPGRISEISGLGLRALIAASIACLMTACIAGVMYDESIQHFNLDGNQTTATTELVWTTDIDTTLFTTLST
ncbi:putative sodium/nucleoside cotransporter 2 isoform X2 [Apostichopus japonicus]|uniref:Sodium/nucleoside cotransporter n=1 Tax=Stichopus japonicus TaxID=307972 RepID=A0A2G8KTT6_STIJA|nr:putative sodium/nucleoside cotransporter 2 isoform X2 [Apostichopus japonicus]